MVFFYFVVVIKCDYINFCGIFDGIDNFMEVVWVVYFFMYLFGDFYVLYKVIDL